MPVSYAFLTSKGSKFVFLPKKFPATISRDVPLRACGFLMQGKGNVAFVTVHFLDILIIIMFSIYT